LKRDICAFTDGLNVVERINPVRYKWNGLWRLPNDGVENVSVIAQELEAVAPYAVAKERDKLYTGGPETDVAHIHPEALIYVLINAVQQMEKRVRKLREETLP
jgi:hypothetical protein